MDRLFPLQCREPKTGTSSRGGFALLTVYTFAKSMDDKWAAAERFPLAAVSPVTRTTLNPRLDYRAVRLQCEASFCE